MSRGGRSREGHYGTEREDENCSAINLRERAEYGHLPLEFISVLERGTFESSKYFLSVTRNNGMTENSVFFRKIS